MSKSIQRNNFLNSLEMMFDGVKENIQPPYYTFFEDSVKLKKNINEEEFEAMLFETLYSFWKIEKEGLSVHDYSLIRFDELRPQFLDNILFFLMAKLPMPYFKKLITVFENLVNSEHIYGDTDFYRSILLNAVDKGSLNKYKEKIELICLSEILNKNNNSCDLQTKEIFGDEFHGCISLSSFYENFMLKAWCVMSKFYDNEPIINHYYPDNKSKYICNDLKNIYISDRINLNKIEPGLFLRKFDVEVLLNIQEFIMPLSIKRQIHNVLNAYMQNDTCLAKQSFLRSLSLLELTHVDDLKKIYPKMLGTITHKNIDDFWIPDCIMRRSLYNKSDNIKEIINKYNLEDILSCNSVFREQIDSIIKNNIKSILEQDNALFVKKSLNKAIKVKEKSKASISRI